MKYDQRHRDERAKWAPVVASGVVVCRRASNGTCLEASPLIGAEQPWDLGHPDAECTAPKGPEHERCNRATRNRPERYQA